MKIDMDTWNKMVEKKFWWMYQDYTEQKSKGHFMQALRTADKFMQEIINLNSMISLMIESNKKEKKEIDRSVADFK